MRQTEIYKTTTHRGTYNKIRREKIGLDEGHCPYCDWHTGCNLDHNIEYVHNEEKFGNVSWKTKSKKRKQWMDNYKKFRTGVLTDTDVIKEIEKDVHRNLMCEID